MDALIALATAHPPAQELTLEGALLAQRVTAPSTSRARLPTQSIRARPPIAATASARTSGSRGVPPHATPIATTAGMETHWRLPTDIIQPPDVQRLSLDSTVIWPQLVGGRT